MTDGNPSYPAGIHFLNAQRAKDLIHRKVIGLQNLDSESAAYRPYKELIERLNRTFKHHMRPSHGFNSVNGAVALVTLFVTHYNFLRPHTSLKWQVPIPLKELEGITTIQGKWAKILSLAERSRRTLLFFNNCHFGNAPKNAKMMKQLLGIPEIRETRPGELQL